MLVMICRIWKDRTWVSGIAFVGTKGQVDTPMVCEEQVERMMDGNAKSHRSMTC